MQNGETFSKDGVLTGSVVRIVFSSDSSSWTVIEIENEDGINTVVGDLEGVYDGEHLEITGEWINHPKFGMQFKTETYKSSIPHDGENLFRYLSSGVIKGIGAATAAKIIDKFGADTLDIIENSHTRLSEIRGITLGRAEQISAQYSEQTGLRKIILEFSDFGITASEALRCWKRFGDTAPDKIRNNPYLLCSSGLRISFERADAICKNMGSSDNNLERVKAGTLHVMKSNILNGHTCLPAGQVMRTTSRLLEVDISLVKSAIKEMIAEFIISHEKIDKATFLF